MYAVPVVGSNRIVWFGRAMGREGEAFGPFARGNTAPIKERRTILVTKQERLISEASKLQNMISTILGVARFEFI